MRDSTRPRALAWSALPAPLAQREPFSCSCCGNRQCPEPRAESGVAGMGIAHGFHSSRAQESWAGPVWASGFPKMYNFRSWKTCFNLSKRIAPHDYFIIRITAKETRESSSPWCLAPAEAGTRVPGTQGRAYPSATTPSSAAPFLSHPLSPSVSSSSNTNCLHGKSPSMTRFSTHKGKLWATDPTS